MGFLTFACGDGRLKASLAELEERIVGSGADRIQLPGGPLALLAGERERASILEWLELVAGAHNVGTVLLVSHEDCLGYRRRLAGAPELPEREVLRRDLLTVKGILEVRLRGAHCDAYIIPRVEAGEGLASSGFGRAQPIG